MKTPDIRRFKKILFCNTHRNECKKVDKNKKKCNSICSLCENSEEIYQHRNT